MPKEKVPPHNINAEASVLGALLLSPEAVVQVVDYLKPEHFYDPRHRVIFQVIVDLFRAGKPVDLVTVTEFLRKKRKLRSAGGAEYISELVDQVPTSAHVQEYAQVVKEHAVRRALIESGGKITELAFKESKDINEVLAEAQRMLFDVSVEGVKRNFVHVKDILEDVYENVVRITESDQLLGLSTGFKDLDKLLGGFQKSDLIILAARPSVGKTSLALDFLRHIVLREKKNAAMFSLEMSKEQLMMRLLAMESGIGLWNVRQGSLTDEELMILSEVVGKFSEAGLWIDDEPGLNIVELKARARRLYLEHKIDFLVIDYLQLIRGTRQESRVQEVSEISQELKNIARELDIPVLAISQLSRRVEDRADKMPQLADLRDSGSIEQDADVVMFIHREELYDPDTDKKGIADLKVAKHRNGPTGTIQLAWIKEISSFRDLAKEEEPEDVE